MQENTPQSVPQPTPPDNAAAHSPPQSISSGGGDSVNIPRTVPFSSPVSISTGSLRG